MIVVHAHNTAVACCPPPLAPAERLPGAADRGVKRFYKTVGVHAADAAGRPVDDEASEDIVREPLIVRVADVACCSPHMCVLVWQAQAGYQILIEGRIMKTAGMNRLLVRGEAVDCCLSCWFGQCTH